MLKQWQKIIVSINVAFLFVWLLSILITFANFFEFFDRIFDKLKYGEDIMYASIAPSLLAPIFCGLGLLFVLFVLYRSSFSAQLKRMLIGLLVLNVLVFAASISLLGGFAFLLYGGEGQYPTSSGYVFTTTLFEVLYGWMWWL